MPDELVVRPGDIDALRWLVYDICAAANQPLDESMLETIEARLEQMRPLLAQHDEITPDLLRRLLAETQ